MSLKHLTMHITCKCTWRQLITPSKCVNGPSQWSKEGELKPFLTCHFSVPNHPGQLLSSTISLISVISIFYIKKSNMHISVCKFVPYAYVWKAISLNRMQLCMLFSLIFLCIIFFLKKLLSWRSTLQNSEKSEFWRITVHLLILGKVQIWCVLSLKRNWF